MDTQRQMETIDNVPETGDHQHASSADRITRIITSTERVQLLQVREK